MGEVGNMGIIRLENVLNDGIGFIELRDYMGNDDRVVEAARVSYDGDETDETYHNTAGLIRYMANHNHGTPFEHTAFTFVVKCPFFVRSQWHRHRIGWCLPGSAQIHIGKNSETRPLRHIYKAWKEGVTDIKGRTRLLPSCQNYTTRTINEETGFVEFAEMVDVYATGVKPIIKITTSTGKQLRCTKEHKLYAELEEWVEAGNLSVGDRIHVQGRKTVGSYQGIPKRLRMGIQEWATRQKHEHVKDIDKCYICDNFFSFSQLEYDHVIPVSTDLSKALNLDNLKPACTSCHQTKTNQEGISYDKRAIKLGAVLETIIDIQEDGEEDTYDIEMPAPNHNYIADGFVVHNSYNEISRRYTSDNIEFYKPDAWHKQDKKNKQQSAQKLHKPYLDFEYDKALEQAMETYERLLGQGVSREEARFVLPQATYTRFYATCNLRSLVHFIKERSSPDAQKHIQAYSDIMRDMTRELFPISIGALLDEK